jgi:hypothetical protein
MAEIRLEQVVKNKYAGSASTAYILRAEDGSLTRQVVTPDKKGVATVVQFDEYFNTDVKLVSEYCKQFGGVTPQSIDYLVSKGKIDFVRLGKSVVIVMSEFTRQYTPNLSKKRGGLGADILKT